MEQDIEMHTNCDSFLLHPNGQLQMVKECWCKLYHVFGQAIQFEETVQENIVEDIYCVYLKNGEKYQQPMNMVLSKKLGKKISGSGIMFRKGNDLSLEKVKSLLN